MNKKPKPAFIRILRSEDAGWAIKTHFAYYTLDEEIVGRGHYSTRTLGFGGAWLIAAAEP